MKITFVFAILLTFFLSLQNAQAQQDEYLPYAQVMPEPVGGLQTLYSKISYPEMAKRNGVEGKVYVMAYVNKQGAVDDVKVIKGIGSGCDEAAIDGIRKTKFTVGKNEGAAVNVKVSLSIVFKINS